MTKPDSPAEAQLAPAPKPASQVATEIVNHFQDHTKLEPAAAGRLKDLIVKALDERFAEEQDIRLGRVLGSALATL